MKKLPVPAVDDTLKITATSQSARLHRTSYPHLRNELQAILNGYLDYDSNYGNALSVASVNINNTLKTALKKHYSSPPSDLKFIDELRASSPNVCPMCGSLKTGTLDHLFPKDDYPWFAVYSKNLVPACDCNSKRGTNLKDGTKRILHPYYDLFLNQRLLSCQILADPVLPKFKVDIVYVDPTHTEIESIKFHVEKIVLPSGLLNWIGGEWEVAAESPSSKFHTLPLSNIASIADFRRHLEGALTRHDNSYGSPNNWFSIFTHGVLNSNDACQYLFDRHNSLFP